MRLYLDHLPQQSPQPSQGLCRVHHLSPRTLVLACQIPETGPAFSFADFRGVVVVYDLNFLPLWPVVLGSVAAREPRSDTSET